jgi:hypothetical protein
MMIRSGKGVRAPLWCREAYIATHAYVLTELMTELESILVMITTSTNTKSMTKTMCNDNDDSSSSFSLSLSLSLSLYSTDRNPWNP